MVIDPNVLVSAAISHGVSRQLIDLASTGAFITAGDLVRELMDPR